MIALPCVTCGGLVEFDERGGFAVDERSIVVDPDGVLCAVCDFADREAMTSDWTG